MNVILIWKEGTLKGTERRVFSDGETSASTSSASLLLAPLMTPEYWSCYTEGLQWSAPGQSCQHVSNMGLFPSGSLMHLNSFDSSQHFPRQKEELLQTSLLTSSFPSHFHLYNSRKAKSLWRFGDLISDILREGACGIPFTFPWISVFQNCEKSSVCD